MQQVIHKIEQKKWNTYFFMSIEKDDDDVLCIVCVNVFNDEMTSENLLRKLLFFW